MEVAFQPDVDKERGVLRTREKKIEKKNNKKVSGWYMVYICTRKNI